MHLYNHRVLAPLWAIPLSLSHFLARVHGHGCPPLPHYQLPQGLIDEYNASGFPGAIHILATVAGLDGGWTPGLKQYETPIAIRFTHLIDVMNWNCAAVYSSNWKDALTKAEPLLRSPTTTSVSTAIGDDGDGVFATKDVDLHTSDARLLCMVHSWATVVRDWVPEAVPTLMGVINSYGYLGVSDTYNKDVDDCFNINTDGAADKTCLVDAAVNECYSPSIMGAIVARQLTEYARRDGWNMYGTLNKDGTPCTANCRRYTDTTGYAPVSSKFRWQPLLEGDGRGYETRQEHVTPHIGLTGKTAILSTTDFQGRLAPTPNYINEKKYNAEALALVQRLSVTATNDTKKMTIEFFDDKFKVVFAVIRSVVMLGLTFEQVLNFVLGLTASDYDAILVAWKEKRNYDLVRPTTWIQEQMANVDMMTYAGPGMGVTTIKGKNFEAWVRVMPHSEYVSGSGCICQAIYEYTDEWINFNLGLNNSIAVPLPPFAVGSSKTEPDLTPQTEINIVMDNMLELRNACGQSRLDGGMHFTASIQSSYDLCQGIGSQGVDYTSYLVPSGSLFT